MADADAHDAYLFQHGLLQEAAYLLHLPSERARLHLLAFQSLEENSPPESREVLVIEMAKHLTAALMDPEIATPELRARQLGYLKLAAKVASRQFLLDESVRFHQATGSHPDATPEERIHALMEAGRYSLLLAATARGRGYLEQAVKLAEEHGSARELVEALNQLTVHAMDLGDLETGKALLQRLEDVTAGDAAFTYVAESARARWHDATGEYAQAEDHYRRCMQLALDSGETGKAGRVMVNLGGLLNDIGNADDAREVLRRGCDLLEQAGDLRSLAVCLGNVAWVEQTSGDLDEAEAYFARAVKAAAEIGSLYDEAVILGNLGNMYLDRKELESAGKTFERALTLHREIGNRRHEAIVLGDYAIQKLYLKQFDDAESYARRALDENLRLHNKRSAAVCLSTLARVQMTRKDFGGACTTFREAIRVSTEAGDIARVSVFKQLLGECLLLLGHEQEGRSLLHEALESFRERDHQRGITEVEAILNR